MDISKKEAKMIGRIFEDIVQADATETSSKEIMEKYCLTREEWEIIELLAIPLFKMRSKAITWRWRYIYLKSGVENAFKTEKEVKPLKELVRKSINFSSRFGKETLAMCKCSSDLFKEKKEV